jgi:hypothetical protein
MPLTPDTKDWTWVLDRRCDECGFDASTLDARAVAGIIRDNVERWRAALGELGDEAAHRTRVDRWSPLEYACHVRDVYRLYDRRLAMMLGEDDPTFPNWDQDATAVEDRYGEQDPSVVMEELAEAAEQLARSFDRVGDEQWGRTGTRSDGARFTVDTFSRYLVHDPIHHVWDVTNEQTT